MLFLRLTIAFALLGYFTLAVQAADEPAAPSIEGQFLTNIRQVTSGMTKAGEGYFSPRRKIDRLSSRPLGISVLSDLHATSIGG